MATVKTTKQKSSAKKTKSALTLKRRFKVNKWMALGVVAVIAAIGVYVVRASHASGTVWGVDQLMISGKAAVENKSDGTKKIKATVINKGDYASIYVPLRYTSATSIPSKTICADVSVSSSTANMSMSYFDIPIKSDGTLAEIGGAGPVPSSFAQGKQKVCGNQPPQQTSAAPGIEKRYYLVVNYGTVYINNIHEENTAKNQTRGPFSF